MSGIKPEAAQPTTTQAFEQSDRNPAVASWGGTNAGGGPMTAPSAGESRMTPPGSAVSPNAGLQNYDTGDTADAVENEAEGQG
ncbi:MAG: hypothetical protein WBX38_19080 [Candidatus Sulfotelmatobacter sp.]